MDTSSPISSNNASEYQVQAIDQLIAREPAFSQVIDLFGPPPLWGREPGFATLIRIILEQQVSLASAKAAFDRLAEATGGITPERFLDFDDQQLKVIGFSHQKSAYGRNLASALLSGRLDLDQLPELDDNQVRASLTSIKGIGIWTANIYLLMVLQRPDIWPSGDIALAAAYSQLKKTAIRPSNAEMIHISENWRPWRSVAARLLWHYYLSR